MADDNVKYSVDIDVTGDDDVRRISVEIERVGETGEKSMSLLERAGRSATRSWTDFKSALDVVGRAFGVVAGGATAVFDALEDGAAIDRLNQQFDTLADSIGSTGDSLRTSLKEATQGLVSDTDLIQGATDLISLGLANTEDRAVRLSSVVGALDWDLQVLSLTLANNSTARLDSLGLSMEAVKATAAELAAEGYNLNDAFDLAVLIEGEKRVELMGNAAETTAGRLRILRNTATNAADAFKQAFAKSFADAVKIAADEVDLLDSSIKQAATDAGNLFGNIATTFSLQYTARYLREQLIALGADAEEVDAALKEIGDKNGVGFLSLGFSPADAQAAAEGVAYLADQIERTTAAQDNFINARSGYGEIELVPQEAVRNAQSFEDAASGAYYSYFHIAENVERLKPILADIADNNALEELAQRAAEAWGEYVREVEAASGDIFTDFMREAQNAEGSGKDFGINVKQSIYDALDAAGASAGVLANYAVSVGLIDQATADAVVKATQQQTIIESITQGVADYGLEWEKIPDLIEQAFAALENGGKAPLPPRALPEVEDRGYRAGYSENLNPEPPPIKYEPIPLEVELQTELIEQAVEDAKGIVDGFVNPEAAYNAVMDLDIQSVRDGALEATTLINGIPTEKSVVVNFSSTGNDVIEALRAIGAIK